MFTVRLGGWNFFQPDYVLNGNVVDSNNVQPPANLHQHKVPQKMAFVENEKLNSNIIS